jgi:hypothetical protein
MIRDLIERFDEVAGTVRAVLAELAPVDGLEILLADVRSAFAELADEIPYADRQDHVMFLPAFSVFVYLAIYQALRPRGYDAHRVGRAILAAPVIEIGPSEKGAATIAEDAAASLGDAAPNEFAFELVEGGEESDYGMNIRACAVCHAFGRHDATDLVPYMCALDDVVSDATGQGLRRTGTIALGATHCDFRYKAGGEPLRLADQYPDQIRSGESA